MTAKKVFLVCNAHLDPVWLWQWQEGLAETISTFRTAARFCEEFDGFVFNHNESLLYEWIEKHDPLLFRKIQKLVRQKRWNIMGGWYLQPDCNMPSGESFVRQILAGQTYFKEKFGVEVKTAINFDPFGHSRGLVQIMARAGYDSYLCGRPYQRDCELPAKDFVWVGFDGSEILAHRFSYNHELYNSPLGRATEKIERWIDGHEGSMNLLIPWGVGNHGGGASRKDLRDIARLIKQRPEARIRQSTPQAYFQELKRSAHTLPRVAKSLNRWATGCYSSMARLKKQFRQLENEYFLTEKMVSAAAFQGLMKYPQAELEEALKDLLFVEFHDILPGSSIPPVEQDCLQTIAHGLTILSRIKMEAFLKLSQGQKQAKEGEIPILVYNPHPCKVRQQVECEFNLADAKFWDQFTDVQVYQDGRPLPTQVEHEASSLHKVDWRKRVVFAAELEAGQMSRFDCRMKVLPARKPPVLKTRKGKIRFKTKQLDIVINTRTGRVDTFRVEGIHYCQKDAFGLYVMQDNEDSWGMDTKNYNKAAGRFRLLDPAAAGQFAGGQGRIDAVRVVEDGPVRSVVEALFGYEHSFVCQRYILPKAGTEMGIETRVFWQQKDQMLKLAIPLQSSDWKYLGQVAYGVEEFPSDGGEIAAQKWVAAVDCKRKIALTCLNESTYSYDFTPSAIRLTLLRSPAYSCGPVGERPWAPQDYFVPRMDQGEHVFRFYVNAGPQNRRLEKVSFEAQARNEKPFALSFFPDGSGIRPRPLALVDDPAIQVSVVKQSEQGRQMVIRLHETAGKKRSTVLRLPLVRKSKKVNLGPYEIKTLKVNPAAGTIIQTNLLEK